MGETKLCLLLLLGTCALAQQDIGNAESQTCHLAKRFKNFRRFVYQYEAESFNGVHGATNLKNGPRVTCKVEIDVPQTCSLILRTTECSLSEVVDISSDGSPVFAPAAGAEAFQAAMEKNPLKVMVEGQTDVKLFPDEAETTTILNIKRGIVSALIVPALEDEKNKYMATLHGVCVTDFAVNSREDIATDVTLTRDLSECDSFIAQRDHTSPLAIISGMQKTLSKLISSKQTCNYKFDNQKKHMTAGSCTEKHIFLPFSHQTESGVSTLVKQTLTLLDTSKINERVFNHNEANLKNLTMEAAEDKAAIQNTDSLLATIRELSTLSKTNKGNQRASIFQRLVTELRGLNLVTMSPAVPEMVSVSNTLTWQALAQCGTPECSSAMLQQLRTFDNDAMEVDAAVYALGLLPNPSRLLVKEMLRMAQYKQSKPIMFALGNVVRKLYQAEGKVTPEIAAVAEYLASLLGADCAGEKDLTFLILRVVGNIGDIMEAADPTVKTTLLKCMRQPATTLQVQLAAIQAFRRMSVTDEVRSNLQRVTSYAKGAVQKRLAAYLILMRNPEASDLEVVKKVLKASMEEQKPEVQEQNSQVKAFVSSHIYNIIHSNDPETRSLGVKILDVLDDPVNSQNDYTTLSHNYKMDAAMNGMKTSMQGNMIFDPTSRMPKEIMLETTLKAFGYNMDMLEIGLEGKDFEPTIEALFGKNGFFPDTVSKALYWAGDKMPDQVNEVLKNFASPLKNEKSKIPENIMREIVRNFNKLTKDLQAQESPEAMVYLRIMGTELGYIKDSEVKSIAQNAAVYADILLKTMPTQFIQKLVASTDNEVFAHYIFMDNKFSLSTASGFPLKFSLSGTFAPGAKGGLRIHRNMQEVSFMPSVGVEFVTQMGVHIPEFVNSAVEMHTNMYHESALNAKVTMEQNQIKLSIPAPQGTTQLFRVSNRMLTVARGHATPIPDMDEGRTSAVNCSPLFSGAKYCTTARYINAGDNAAAPYFPLNGETEFALDIQPTGEVSEYTATFAYELRSEGKEGRQKIDTMKMILKAEGAKPTDAGVTATVKYNRNRNVLTTNVQIPNYDVEAGIRVGLSDSRNNGKSITIDITDRNIPQLSLIGRAKLESMESTLQLQLIVPALKTDAAITAAVKNDKEFTLELTSEIKLPETTSIQGVTFKFDETQVQIHTRSDMGSEIQKLLPHTEALQTWLKQVSDDLLDQQVVKTDMKLRHIFTKSLEAGSNWMNKMNFNCPMFKTLKDNVPELSMPALPERLFLKSQSTFKYKFNNHRVTITVPMLFGGKSSEDLRIPAVLTTPLLSVPQVGLELPSKEFQVPTFSIPNNYDLSVPLFGMVELSAKVNSNFYTWEGMVSGGNNSVDTPSYIAQFKVAADSPNKLLAFQSEGTALVTDTPEGSLKAFMNGSLSHKLINTNFEIMEAISMSDKVRATGNHKIKVISPLGLETSLEITSQASLASDVLIGDANMDGSVTLGSVTGSTTYSHSFSVEPMKREARAESTLRVNTPILEIVNRIKAGYADEKLLIESNTNLNNDPIKHTTKVSIGYKAAQLTVQSDSVTKAEDKMIRSQLDFTGSMEKASIRIENQADDTQNRAYSLLSGALNSFGLEINADASVNIRGSRASHKAALTLNQEGLATSATTTAQSNPITFENVFNGGIDTTRAHVSVNTKGAYRENAAEFNLEGKVTSSEGNLNSMFKGNLFDANTMNRVNMRVNKDGLALSNKLVAGLYQMETENTHSLTLTLKTLALRSKTDSFFNKENAYKHDISVDISVESENFGASVNVNNDLKVIDCTLVNKAMYKLEPYRMELGGSLKGACSEMANFQHTYELSFADMTATAKCNTNGKYALSQITHTADLEIAGLSTKFNSVSNINSQTSLWTAVNVDNTVNVVAEPFKVDISALFKSNGKPNLFGIQNIELFNQFLLKAEPLSFAHSHEYKASTTFQLENGDSFNTKLDNKISSRLSPQEQHASMKLTSKLNNHEFNHELSALNNAETMGMELKAAIITTILNKDSEKQEYAISGAVNYEKNSDSHFIQLPFSDHLPAVIDQVTIAVMKTIENSKGLLMDIDTKYKIRTKIQENVGKLKQAFESFNLDLFIQDLKVFISSVESYIPTLITKIPTEDIINVLKSIRDAIMKWIKKINITEKINAIYTKIDEILTKYEIEKMVENTMEEVVLIMKSYHIREHIQSAKSRYLKRFDISGPVNNLITLVNNFVNELNALDFKQLLEDISVYFDRLTDKIRSFDYKTFAEELKQNVNDLSRVPCFGKLNGEFRVTSPDYSMTTTAAFHNATTTQGTPEFYIILNSQATSTSDLLSYTLDAKVDIAVPKMSRLSLSDNIKFMHTAFSVDHQGAAAFYGTSAQSSSKTNVKATTKPYNAELVSNAFFAIENGISTKLENTYNHKMNLPLLNTPYSEVALTQKAVALLEAGVITLTLTNDGKGKYAIHDYSDEGTHKCNMEVVMNFNTVKLTFTGATDTNNLKMKQNLNAEARLFSHINIEANTEAKTPFFKSSVAELKAEAQLQDLKMQVTASHITELVGSVEGIISNSINVVAKPYEFVFDTKNKETTKVALPFRLTGKIDLQNDIAITLNSGVQQASWTGLARFNQYKYSHYFTMDNGDQEIHVFAQMNGAANLEALREPISLPKGAAELFGRSEISLWEDTGLGLLLITPQQIFDMDTKLIYKKNPELVIIDIKPIINGINKNTQSLKREMILNRDKAVVILSNTFQQAKAEYEKYNIELPKTITVPAYRVPVLDVDLHSFSIPVPDISVITMPKMHIPSALSKLTVPKITLPKMPSSIRIPVFGDLTYEFSMKTAVLTVKANASILNQDDFIVTFDVSSTSEFDVLKAKMDGTSTLERNNGVKLASILNLESMCIKGSHDSTISHNGKSIDASIKNNAMVNVPTLWTLEVNQEVFVNAQEGLIISVSSPNAGLIGLQLQAKKPAQMKGRVYGRYPSDLTTDVDILTLKMSVINSEMLKLQTTWNMEVPTEVLLVVKKKVPEIMSAIPMEDILSAQQQIADKLEGSMEMIVDQGKVIYKRAATNFASMELTPITEKLSESVMVVFRQYEKTVQVLLNAAIKFLKETHFEVPGIEGYVSGLEVYEKLSGYFAELLENAIRKVPETCTSACAALLEQIRNIEFILPGSKKSIAGGEILDDLTATMKKMQQQVIIILKKVREITLEDLVSKAIAFLRLTVEKTEDLIVSLKSQDTDKLTAWMNDIYSSAVNSHAMSDITQQIKEAQEIIRDYCNLVRSKIDELFAGTSVEQLSTDIQSWIDSLIRFIDAVHTKVIDFVQDITKNTESFVTVSDKQIDIEIPMPFIAQLDM
ncbi:hypothetical protein UPYG_G00276120 [Umbra pygmaea]|uniref:Vitellogenin domain-containing protein n=1 Tax=Umbra pygmaea TaxID=75934 RepID=A0ABD0W3A2_UMBPY